jgi:hypothetical protein
MIQATNINCSKIGVRHEMKCEKYEDEARCVYEKRASGKAKANKEAHIKINYGASFRSSRLRGIAQWRGYLVLRDSGNPQGCPYPHAEADPPAAQPAV